MEATWAVEQMASIELVGDHHNIISCACATKAKKPEDVVKVKKRIVHG